MESIKKLKIEEKSSYLFALQNKQDQSNRKQSGGSNNPSINIHNSDENNHSEENNHNNNSNKSNSNHHQHENGNSSNGHHNNHHYDNSNNHNHNSNNLNNHNNSNHHESNQNNNNYLQIQSQEKKKIVISSDGDTESIGSNQIIDTDDTNYNISFNYDHLDQERTNLLWRIDGTKLYNYFQSKMKQLKRIEEEGLSANENDNNIQQEQLQSFDQITTAYSDSFQSQNSNKFMFGLYYDTKNEHLILIVKNIYNAFNVGTINIHCDITAYLDGEKLVNFYGFRHYEMDKGEDYFQENITDTIYKSFDLKDLKNKELLFSGFIRQRGSEKMNSIEYVGLKNQGNTCYMNSYLQTLYHLSEFTRLVLKIPTQAQPLKFPDSMQILYFGLYKENKPDYFLSINLLFINNEKQTTVELCKSFGWDREDAFVQQDVQEFSCNIIEALESKVDKYANLKGEVQRLFQGQIKNYIKCKNVNYQSERFETFFDIQLQVKDKKDVYESLKDYTSEELMSEDNQYDTEDPQFGKQDAIKGLKFVKLPPILQLTLKRFDFDYQKMRLVKILDKYNYPSKLDMSEFMDQSVYENGASKEDFTYSLQAVLIHSGQQSGSGHYYVFIRKQNSWYKFNDSQVDVISELQVMLGGEGGDVFYKKYSESLKKIDEYSISKKETAYMLVYVQMKQQQQILRDLSDEDIPEQIKNYYEQKNRQLEMMKRKREYFSVKVCSFNDVAQTNGNSIVYQKEYANSYISTENFDDIGKTIELKRTITLNQFIQRVARQLCCQQEDILLFKITYQNSLEKLVNLSRFLNVGMGNVLLKNLLYGFSSDQYDFNFCILILTNKADFKSFTIDAIQENYNDFDEEEEEVINNPSVSPVQKSEEKNEQIEFEKQKIVIFYKKLIRQENENRMGEGDDQQDNLQNELQGYVIANLEDNLSQIISQIAYQQNDISEIELQNRYRIYKEKQHKIEQIMINDSIDQSAYSIFANRFYGVLVFGEITQQTYITDVVEEYYTNKSNLYQITLEPNDPNDTIQESRQFTVNGNYSFEYLQMIINEKQWEELPISDESTISKVEHQQQIKFGYDNNLNAVDRSKCVNFSYLLMDHSEQGYIINKPIEQSINISKSSILSDLIQLIESEPKLIHYHSKENLADQVMIGMVKQRNCHILFKPINQGNPVRLLMNSRFKYLHILERAYNQNEDYLIAGSFSDGEGQSFGHPFIMVQRKDLKISQFYEILNHHFKNKKINKFFDSDIQSTINKFDCILTISDEKKIERKITDDSDNEDTLETLLQDFQNQNQFVVLLIRIYGIDLSTNIKKITSTQE